MNFDFTGYEAQIEEQEQDIEQFDTEKQKNTNRIEHLQKAISVLEGDYALTSLIERNKEDLLKENGEIEKKIEERKGIVFDIEQAIISEANEISYKMGILEELSEMGEDVSEAWKVVEDRRNVTIECMERLKKVAERLGIELTEIGDEPGGTYGTKHLVKSFGEGDVKKK